MIERLEVTPGPGTVIRFGHLAAWMAAGASANLVSFLAESARNLAPSSVSGEQLADHLTDVLQHRDPEPDVAFAVVGPSQDGWVGVLHGPVQAWDGVRWTAPDADPGWMRVTLAPHPALSISVSGSGVPSIGPEGVLDLEAGVVPGGGFVLVPAVTAVSAGPAVSAAAGGSDGSAAAGGPDGGLSPVPVGLVVDGPVEEGEKPTESVAGAGGSEPVAGAGGSEPAATATIGYTIADDAGADAAGAEGPATPASATAEPASASTKPSAASAGSPAEAPPPPADVVDLRSSALVGRIVVYPPLPPGGDPPGPVPGAPVVNGVPCRRGHLNRPGLVRCARCGHPIDAGDAYHITGTRPALGCLVTDGGALYRLDTGYVIGTDPGGDATVRGGLARPLVLPGGDVAATHAEVQLQDWDVVVIDRASESGTHVYPPENDGWIRLDAYRPRVLEAGTHLAFGSRIITFLTPWTPTGQDTSPRY